MATVIVRASDYNVSPSLVEIEIFIREEDWVGKFDQIEVWRSKETDGGPYEELTAPNWWSARIPFDATDPPAVVVTGPVANVSGKDLQFVVNEQITVLIQISGVDPLSYSAVAAQITAGGQGLIRAYVEADGRLTVETLNVGTGQQLRIVPTDAATLLGLPTTEPDSISFGRDVRLSLAPDEELYTFNDLLGGGEYFYKIRLRNSLTGAVGAFSQPFVSESGIGASPTLRVLGTLQVLDGEGKPIQSREVRISTIFTGQSIDGAVVVGGDLLKTTDKQGRVEFSLLRGQPITVAIAGTNLVKQVVPPTDPEIATFNLLDAAYSSEEDYFKARVVEIPYAARRTL
jgi:hypothetical protein